MKVEYDDKTKQLTIQVALNVPGPATTSGKSNSHYSTGAPQKTAVQVNGKALVIGLNCYTPKG